MTFSQKVRSFVFSASSEKEAYLKGCKQLARFTASDKYSNLSFQVERLPGKDAFRFTIFANIDVNQAQKEFCTVCKELHCSFFINEDYNCSRCNMKSFMRKMKQKVDVSKGFYSHRIQEKSNSIDSLSEIEIKELDVKS